MKIRHFCTYFDHNYLPRAMVMLESLHAHAPHAIVHVLCLSDQCHDVMQKLAYPFVRLIMLQDFEAANPDLLAVRPTRSLVEYYFTMTPCLPWHILHTEDGIDAITYLDADMMFFSSVEPIFEEAGDASVILTPHRFAPHLLSCTAFGEYNVSWVTFRHSDEGKKALAWYKNRCLDWCCDTVETVEGEVRFADQKYLDYMPKLFSNAHVLAHKGAGLAPWNISECTITDKHSVIYIDEKALIFYHAQNFKPLNRFLFASGLSLFSMRLSHAMREHIFFPYCKLYRKNVQKVEMLSSGMIFSQVRTNTVSSLKKRLGVLYHEIKHRTLLLIV